MKKLLFAPLVLTLLLTSCWKFQDPPRLLIINQVNLLKMPSTNAASEPWDDDGTLADVKVEVLNYIGSAKFESTVQENCETCSYVQEYNYGGSIVPGEGYYNDEYEFTVRVFDVDENDLELIGEIGFKEDRKTTDSFEKTIITGENNGIQVSLEVEWSQY